MSFFSFDRAKTKYLILILIFLIVMIFLTVEFGPWVTALISNHDAFREFIDSYGSIGVLVFIAFQILQVVVAAIPGEFVQIAGGYIFGTFWGTVFSVIGILIGATLAFFLARLLGIKVVSKLLSEKSIERFKFIISTRKSETIIFLLFLIPGLPKDILVYVAGLSPIRPLRFFTIYTLARMPGLIGSSMIGSHLQDKNYILAIAIFALSCLLFLIGVLFRKNILKKLKGHHEDNAQ